MRYCVLFLTMLSSGGVMAAPALKGPNPDAVYFPTTIGAKWVYECRDGELETTVVVSVTKDGEDLIVAREGVDGTRTVYSKMIVAKEGLRQARDVAGGKVGWVLKTKLAAGSSWETPEGEKPTVHGPEDITVPAGKFTALRVDWERNGGKYASWYAPGIGEIKRTESRGEVVTVLRALKSFERNDKK